MWRFCLLEFLDVERSDDQKRPQQQGKEDRWENHFMTNEGVIFGP